MSVGREFVVLYLWRALRTVVKGLGYFSTLLEEFKAGYRVKVGEIWKRGKKLTLKMSIYH